MNTGHLIESSIPSEADVNETVEFTANTQSFDNWTWVFGDGEVSNEQNATHSYSEAGIYLVELFITDSNLLDCTVHITQEINVGGLLSGLESTNASLASLAPNTCRNFVRLSAQRQIQSIQIYDLQGRLLKSIDAMSNEFNIDTSELLPGIYFLELETAGQIEKSVQRLVVR